MAAARSRFGGVRKLGAILLLLLALWLVVRNAAIMLFATSAPQIALKFPPASGQAFLSQALLADGSMAAGDLQALLRKGMARAPLSETPFLIAAEQARNMGDHQASALLLDRAVQRNSRRPISRASLLEGHIRQGRWDEAIDDARIIFRTKEAAPEITRLLLMLAEHPDARRVLFTKLEEDPRWRQGFLSYARRIARRDKSYKDIVTEIEQLGSTA